jgi:hypothetical protein
VHVCLSHVTDYATDKLKWMDNIQTNSASDKLKWMDNILSKVLTKTSDQTEFQVDCGLLGSVAVQSYR